MRIFLLWCQRDTDANNCAGEFLHEGTARPLSKAAKWSLSYAGTSKMLEMSEPWNICLGELHTGSATSLINIYPSGSKFGGAESFKLLLAIVFDARPSGFWSGLVQKFCILFPIQFFWNSNVYSMSLSEGCKKFSVLILWLYK